ncbi:MAG: TM1802 family CRISPR-associated protein, partial [Thermoplasmatota archaeon]
MVLNSLYELGKHIEKNEGVSKFESLLSLDRLADCKKIIAIKFQIKDDGLKYVGTHVEGYDKNKGRKMLYMRGSPRGGDNSPTSKITRLYETIEDKEKAKSGRDTLQRIWDYGWFKKEGANSELTKKIKKEYQDKEEKIRNEVYSIYENLETDEKRNSVLTLKLIKNDRESFIDDFEVFNRSLEKIALNKLKNKYGVKSEGKGVCALCKEEKDVTGFAFPFPFYTLDKKGFAPYLDTSKSHQRIPICEDCSFYLQIGKNFLEDNAFNFNIPFEDRIKYYVIMDFILGAKGEDTYSNLLSRIENAKLKNEVDFPLISVEDYMTEVIMKENPSILNLHFLFYSKPQQSQQRIEEFVTDVPPSYLREIKNKINKIKNGWLLDQNNLGKIGLDSFNIKSKERGYLESLI